MSDQNDDYTQHLKACPNNDCRSHIVYIRCDTQVGGSNEYKWYYGECGHCHLRGPRSSDEVNAAKKWNLLRR